MKELVIASTKYTEDKLFQICAPDLKPIMIELVKELSQTTRGDGGFGSTNSTNK